MTSKQVIEMLKETSVFSPLKDRQLRSIVKVVKERTFEPGEVIVGEGEMGVALYLILDGRAEVRRGRRVLSKLKRGEFFGEMALFDNQPRSADVVAVEATKCLILTAWHMHGLVASNPKMALKLLQVMARRLRDTDQALSE